MASQSACRAAADEPAGEPRFAIMPEDVERREQIAACLYGYLDHEFVVGNRTSWPQLKPGSRSRERNMEAAAAVTRLPLVAAAFKALDSGAGAALWRLTYGRYEEHNGTADQAWFEDIFGTETDPYVPSCEAFLRGAYNPHFDIRP